MPRWAKHHERAAGEASEEVREEVRGKVGEEVRDDVRRLAQEAASEEARSAARARELLDAHPRAERLAGLAGEVLRTQSADRLGLSAAGAAFWLVISALPAASAVVTIFGLVLTPAQVAADVAHLAGSGTGSLGQILSDQLTSIAGADRTGLSLGLGFSILLTLWSVSAGVYNLDRAIRSAYGLPRVSFLRARLRALAGGLSGVLAGGVLALLAGAVSFSLSSVTGGLVALVALPVLLVVLAGAIAAVYRFSVGHKLGLRRLGPGAAVAAVTLVVVVAGFGAYLRVSTHYTAVYGVLAGAVIGMMATYLAVYAVLLGAVVNARLDARSGLQPPAPTTGRSRTRPASDPAKGASPKAKTPPSDPTSQ